MLNSKLAGLILTFSVTLLIFGCDAPTLVPTAPPGQDYHEFLPEQKVDDSKLPQALGEQGRALAKASSPTAAILPDLEPAPPTKIGETKTTKSGVKYETLAEGTGAVAKAGQVVKMLYKGTLEDGKTFDATKNGEPRTFTVGVGTLIKAWDEGVPGMKIGEKRKLYVPASAGYGALGKSGTIPPNAPLIFEIELVDAHDQE